MRELMRGGIGSLSDRAGVSPWSELPVSGRAEVPPESGLPLNRILYIPFRIFAYSSNIVIVNLVRIESMFAEGTLECPLCFCVLIIRDRSRIKGNTYIWGSVGGDT
jgi:hypothetical protein